MIPPQTVSPEKYIVAFVIQGDDVFKITADSIIETPATPGGPSFDGVGKLKAAAALLNLANQHSELPEQLRQMAREMVSEGMRLLARSSIGGRGVGATPLAAPVTSEAKIA